MKVETKIFNENGETIINKNTNGDPCCFEIEFSNVPDIGDKVLIHDGDAKGEFTVEYKIYTVTKNIGSPLLVLKEKSFDSAIKFAIDN